MGANKTGRVLVETGTAGWFEDPDNPGKKTRKKDGDTVLTKAEANASRQKNDGGKDAPTKPLPTGKLTKHPTVEIKCVDCGAKREVQVQDKHQVTRCIQHQKEHRNKRRRERRQEAKSKKG